MKLQSVRMIQLSDVVWPDLRNIVILIYLFI